MKAKHMPNNPFGCIPPHERRKKRRIRFTLNLVRTTALVAVGIVGFGCIWNMDGGLVALAFSSCSAAAIGAGIIGVLPGRWGRVARLSTAFGVAVAFVLGFFWIWSERVSIRYQPPRIM